MHLSNSRFTWAHVSTIGLALLSLVLPVLALLPLPGRTVPADMPANSGNYQLMVVALGLSLLSAGGAFVGARRLAQAGIRRLSIALAIGGLLLSAYLLWTLVGTCGLAVLGGTCRP